MISGNNHIISTPYNTMSQANASKRKRKHHMFALMGQGPLVVV